ncbi:uncharacterized protein RHO25_012263 [Cercospora beticola]|uniref:Uncharacterized protein n=1 Tax=Cercospora beticola TaxID=122368 RepID=A0ABZ0P6U4_CERBT|nr:hypothetical protein RHO25_012263 [Cercospora beticola]
MSTTTIADKIEAFAREPTERVFCSLVLEDASVQDITYSHFLNIINKAATWLDESLPRPTSASDFPTFSYVGDLNLRRLALVVAGAKTGRKILMVRRYALRDTIAHLITETKCTTFCMSLPIVTLWNPRLAIRTQSV